MLHNRHITLLAAWLALAALAALAPAAQRPTYTFPRPAIPCAPKHYVCRRTLSPILVDGRLGEAAWQSADWTEPFVDITGGSGPVPRFRTRAKMLWDENFFYVAAELEEPDVWGTLTRRDAVIFHDNDFEVFIDPDGDTHEYYELEVNALGTEWDLLLTKPYRDDGTAVDAWDISGLATGIAVDGTLNLPNDRDGGWTVELALPWSVLEECAHRPAPPHDGDLWRVNFSRVEWRTETVDGHYVKLEDPASGQPLPEDNWVWSPQGLVAMHYPEMWGYVQFSTAASGEGEAPFVPDPDRAARAALIEVYYRERTHFGRHGFYASDVAELGLFDPADVEALDPSEADRMSRTGAPFSWPPEIHVTPSMFEASVISETGTVLHVSQDGRLW